MHAVRKHPPSTPPPSVVGIDRVGWAWGCLAAIGVYLVVWGAAPLRNLGPVDDRGSFLLRFELLVRTLYPEDLLPLWFEGFSVRGLIDRLPIVALAALIVAGAVGVGELLLRSLPRIAWLTRTERFVLAATLGLNAASLATLLAAWLAPPSLQAAALWLLFLGGALAAAWLGWRERTSAPATDVAAHAPFWTRLDALLVPPALVLLLGGMLPPTDFDVREYHLQAPKEFFQRGHVEFLPHNVYANMPLGGEMYALAAMRMTGDWRLGALAGKLVLAAFAALTALALKAVGTRWAGSLAGTSAAVLYLATPWVLGVSLNGLIEGALAHYLFVAVIAAAAAVQFSQTSRERFALLAVAGFSGGAAAATKYPGMLYAVALPALGLLVIGGAGRWKAPLVFLLAAAVGCGPWYAKNLALTGSPTYPLLYSAFGGATRTPENNEQWEQAHRPDNYAPADLAQRAIDFAGRSEYHSPLLMPLAAIALLDRARRRGVWVLAGYVAAVLACWWLLTHRIDRFWVPVLPVVALLAGLGAQWLAERVRPTLVIWLLIAATTWGCFVAAGGIMAYDRLLADLDACWTDPVRVPAWIARLNRETKPGQRVLSEGDAAVFDLAPLPIYHTAFDRSPLADLAEGQSADAVRQALRDRGIQFVYVNRRELDRYRQPGNYGYDPRVTPELLSRLVAEGVLGEPWPEFREQGVEVYPVRD